MIYWFGFAIVLMWGIGIKHNAQNPNKYQLFSFFELALTPFGACLVVSNLLLNCSMQFKKA